jgi:hypothetical protein
MKHLIEFDAGKLLPFHFILAGTILLFFGVVALLYSPFAGILFGLLGLLILTAKRGVDIDFAKKIYREYHSFYWIKTGKWSPFNSVVKLYINPVKMSQRMSNLASSSTIHSNEYKAYLKFNNEDKVYLLSGKKIKVLEEKLTPLAASLGLSITDNSKLFS